MSTTKLDGSQIKDGSITAVKLETGSQVTTQGNVFNGASQLVKLDTQGRLPGVDGSQLTNLPGGGGAAQQLATTGSPVTIGTASPPSAGQVLSADSATTASWHNFTSSQWITGGSNIHYSAGNVGIGNASPSVALDIIGQLKIADGSQGNGKVFTSNAAGLGSWQSPTGLNGSGATGQLPYFTGSSTLASDANLVYDHTTGILTVEHINVDGEVNLGLITFNGIGGVDILLNSAGSYYGVIQNDSPDVWSFSYKTAPNNAIGPSVMCWTGSGTVGIGTTIPQSALHVAAGWQTITGGGLGLNAHGLTISNEGVPGSGYCWLQSWDNNPLVLNRLGNNVGIATTTPAYTFDVNGTANATAFRVGGTPGASGTFTTVDSKTVTVTNGIITSIV